MRRAADGVERGDTPVFEGLTHPPTKPFENLISDIPRNQLHRLLEIEANSRLNKLLRVWEHNVGVHYWRAVPPRQKLPFIVYNIAWDQQSEDKGCLQFTRANL